MQKVLNNDTCYLVFNAWELPFHNQMSLVSHYFHSFSLNINPATIFPLWINSARAFLLVKHNLITLIINLLLYFYRFIVHRPYFISVFFSLIKKIIHINGYLKTCIYRALKSYSFLLPLEIDRWFMNVMCCFISLAGAQAHRI